MTTITTQYDNNNNTIRQQQQHNTKTTTTVPEELVSVQWSQRWSGSGRTGSRTTKPKNKYALKDYIIIIKNFATEENNVHQGNHLFGILHERVISRLILIKCDNKKIKKKKNHEVLKCPIEIFEIQKP